jgi:hypothetical protein
MSTTTLATVTAVEIEFFRCALAAMLAKHHAGGLILRSTTCTGTPTAVSNGGAAPGVEIMMGRKFARIVRTGVGERSAYGFIDLANGDLLKADGWKQPAKGKRGNIRDGLLGCTPYGLVYHR